MTAEDRDRQAADLLLEHRRAEIALNEHQEHLRRVLLKLRAFSIDSALIEARDGRLWKRGTDEAMPIPTEDDVVEAVRGRDSAAERVDALRQRLAGLGYPVT